MMIVVYGFSFSSDIALLSCSSITDAPFHEAPARLVRVREATRRYLFSYTIMDYPLVSSTNMLRHVQKLEAPHFNYS